MTPQEHKLISWRNLCVEVCLCMCIYVHMYLSLSLCVYVYVHTCVMYVQYITKWKLLQFFLHDNYLCYYVKKDDFYTVLLKFDLITLYQLLSMHKKIEPKLLSTYHYPESWCDFYIVFIKNVLSFSSFKPKSEVNKGPWHELSKTISESLGSYNNNNSNGN